MAGCDYRLCDLCEKKVFYDADLNYKPTKTELGYTLERLGDWVVICQDCAVTHRCIIVEKEDV